MMDQKLKQSVLDAVLTITYLLTVAPKDKT